jgi:PAS domain S-box-containing protein
MTRNKLDFEQVLAELARANVVAESGLAEVLQFLIQRASQALAVNRVSVWLFDAEKTRLFSFVSYNAADNVFSGGEELLGVHHPAYFTALEQLRTIAAIDAENDPRTAELRVGYLRRHRITTMLDAPIFQHGAVIGVVCHEHTDSVREWTEAEKSFAGSMADFISLALEATRRIDAERRLNEREILLRTVAEQMSDGFSLLEPNQKTRELIIRYVNPSAAELYGYSPEEMIGQPSSIVRVSGAEVDLFEQMQAARDCPVVFEALTQHKDGRIIPVEVSLNCVRHENKEMITIVGRDISERKAAETRRMEEQAKTLQAHRLESLGLLAGKISHDFNNLLVSIIGNASLALRNAPENDKNRRYLDNIASTAQIAADLCNQLLIYSGKQDLELASVNLSEIVKEMSGLLEVTLPNNVVLYAEIMENLPLISAEPTQIRQILLNLITNAADALTEKGGEIKINTLIKKWTAESLQREIFDVISPDFISQASNSLSVCLEVTDNGVGMSEATRLKMFEPFFTTKNKGSGRGLGMASLVGIVRSHHGAIKVESQPKKGTTVRVWFPAQNEIIS